MIAIVDYGLGNVQAFVNLYERLGIAVKRAREAADLKHVKGIVLPGVGAFDWAMQRLIESGMREALDEAVLGRGVGVLGVCVGMQIMARRSDEGQLAGLGWIEADVQKLPPSPGDQVLRLPHMGWNTATSLVNDPLFEGIETPEFYFLHSFVVAPSRARDILAVTTYGVSFASVLRVGNIYATQFHPEKSHEAGVRLLRNFAQAS